MKTVEGADPPSMLPAETDPCLYLADYECLTTSTVEATGAIFEIFMYSPPLLN